MKFCFAHNNINVLKLDRSIEFYQQALGLSVTQRYEPDDGSFKLAYLGDGKTKRLLELTWMRDRQEPYNLGDNEFHLAFAVDDYQAALEKHREMGCVCLENHTMGIYFVEDPDGYWLEILPASMQLGST